MSEDLEKIINLYYKYGKTTDDDIRKHLSKISLVAEKNLGVGTYHGYYPLSTEAMEKVNSNPRGTSLTFDATATSDIPFLDLVEIKTVEFLVKSTSRFFLKPDVGEIFDQISFRDLLHDNIKAICLNKGYQELPKTDGEHFILSATLFTIK